MIQEKGNVTKESHNESIKNKEREVASYKLIKGGEIDLIALIKTIWVGRKKIFYSIGICFSIGLLVALLSPVKYTASATLLPSAEKKGSSLGNLSALAGMAGVNLSNMMGDASIIPSQLYPQVIYSYPFQNELINRKLNFENNIEPISLLQYIINDSIESFGDKLKKYTIKLPWTLKELMIGKKEVKENNFKSKLVYISEDEDKALGYVSNMIGVEVDEMTGLVTINVVGSERIVTTEFVANIIELLQDYVIEYKTKQARQSLEFIQERFNEKKREYEDIQVEYFSYRDQHQNVITDRIDLEYQRLKDEYEIISSVFKDLSKQSEAAKIAVMEETPAFTVLEPARVPLRKSSPRRGMILVVSIFIGVIFGVGYVILTKYILDNKLFDNENSQ